MSETDDNAYHVEGDLKTQQERLQTAALFSAFAALGGWLLTSLQVPADNAPLRAWIGYGLVSAEFVSFSVLAVVWFMAWFKRWPTGEEDGYTGWAFLGAFGVGLCIVDWQAVLAVGVWLVSGRISGWLRTLMFEGFRRLSTVMSCVWTLPVAVVACVLAISDWDSFATYWQYFVYVWVLPTVLLDAVFAVGSWVWRGFQDDLNGKTAGGR